MYHRAAFAASVKLRNLFLRETHDARDRRMDGPILPKVGIVPRAELRAFLPDNDAACSDFGTSEELHAAAFRRAIADITRGATGLLVSHGSIVGTLVLLCKDLLEKSQSPKSNHQGSTNGTNPKVDIGAWNFLGD